MERKDGRRRVLSATLTVGLALVLGLAVLVGLPVRSSAAGPCSEQTYANGQEFCIHVSHIMKKPSAALLAQSDPLFIAAYMPLPSGCDVSNQSTCLPETLPSGYQPLCNPCFHGGALNNFPYHDHVLSGAPGFGKNGTAGAMKGPWILIIVVYNSTYSNQANFTPFKSMADIRSGESHGDFLAINPGSSNTFEINTGVVVVFGVQPLGG